MGFSHKKLTWPLQHCLALPRWHVKVRVRIGSVRPNVRVRFGSTIITVRVRFGSVRFKVRVQVRFDFMKLGDSKTKK
jgi:hypothetical protein